MHFPAFGMNTDQNSSEYKHFLRSDTYQHTETWSICVQEDIHSNSFPLCLRILRCERSCVHLHIR